MIIRVIHISKNRCHKECINCKMEQWYKEIYTHPFFYCIDLNTNKIDKNKCIHEFERQYKNQNETIEYIQMNQIKVMNSGIRVN